MRLTSSRFTALKTHHTTIFAMNVTRELGAPGLGQDPVTLERAGCSPFFLQRPVARCYPCSVYVTWQCVVVNWFT